MSFEQYEVMVAVEEPCVVGDAPSADNEVNRLANRDPFAAQLAVECGGPHRLIDAEHRYEIEPPQRVFHGLGFAVRWYAQQDLAENHVAYDKRLFAD